ncbi:asparaginase [Snodgrassella communis]|jgi:L-asparaginase|uniref:asparaginase n=1 Tax=Snodgrassella communis TaxID=2946699 RepID=UPI000C1DDCEA|nr:asparaginase [Snodgrassella communis]PIT22903.1 hypothetical protein BGI35_03330 [Snodgrassella communis]
MTTKKHVAVYYTGGTIGMQQTPAGLAPAASLANLAAPVFQEYSHQLQCDWFISEPLIDSSAITLSNWQTWLNWIDSKAANYDGLLILHGTDTMAYSANIIALARPQLSIPVILTGAMLPLAAVNSDAPLNLRTALAAFSLSGFTQTAIAFNGQLWPAIGSSKISTEQADAFANPQFGTLAQWSVTDGWFNTSLPVSIPTAAPMCHNINPSARIHCFTLTPGANLDMITASLTHNPPEGVVLQSYGNGNTPTDASFLAAIRQIGQQSIPVLNISQVLQGCASAVYAQGHELRAAGVINGGKCNLETALAILTLAASNHWQKEQIENLLHQQQLV